MKNEIKKLFAALEKEEQAELLKELSASAKSSLNISEFAQKHQQKFGQNIDFEIKKSGPDHLPTIKATVFTAFGNYSATGHNQKIAKANACEKALAEWE